jgi:hypothetical protein
MPFVSVRLTEEEHAFLRRHRLNPRAMFRYLLAQVREDPSDLPDEFSAGFRPSRAPLKVPPRRARS